jgi:hypothetical protein
VKKKKPEDFEKRQGKRPKDTCVSDGTRCRQFVVGCFAVHLGRQAIGSGVGEGTEQKSKVACGMLVITDPHSLLNCSRLCALHLTRRTYSTSWARHADGNPRVVAGETLHSSFSDLWNFSVEFLSHHETSKKATRHTGNV